MLRLPDLVDLALRQQGYNILTSSHILNDATQPMRDGNDSVALCREFLVDNAAHGGFRSRVERRRSLVEQKDRHDALPMVGVGPGRAGRIVEGLALKNRSSQRKQL